MSVLRRGTGAYVLLGVLGALACSPFRVHELPPPSPLPECTAPDGVPCADDEGQLPPPEVPQAPEVSHTPEVQPLRPRLRIRAVGDVMLGTDFPEGHLPPGDANILEGVSALLRDADVSFINLEGPLCDGGEAAKCGPAPSARCFAFRTPGPYVHYLKEAGINMASTANNHSGDFGEECMRQTEAFLDSVGIAWSGAPGSIAFLERHGRRVAMVAFHTSARTNHLNNLPEALALLAKARKEAHWVVVSFHGGAEGAFATRVPHGREMFLNEDRGNLRLFARSMVEAGADLVIGHGPHVLRGIELWKGKLIAYSLGNFATYGRFRLTGPLGVGAVLEVVLDEQGNFEEGRVFPTKQVGKGIPLPDEQGEALFSLRELSWLDFPKTGIGVGLDGRLFKEPVQALPLMRLCAEFWPCGFPAGCIAPACSVTEHLEPERAVPQAAPKGATKGSAKGATGAKGKTKR